MTNKDRLEKAESKAMRAMAMRLDGHTYSEIAEACGYATESAASVAVRKIINSTKREMSDEMRVIEAERLDQATQIAWEIARSPKSAPLTKLAAIDRIIKLQERRTKYFGLDKPDKHEHIVRSELDHEIERLMAELGRTIEAATVEEAETAGAGTGLGADLSEKTT
jgi:hypothetical protein